MPSGHFTCGVDAVSTACLAVVLAVKSGLAERSSATLCCLPLELTSGPAFATECSVSSHFTLSKTTLLRNVVNNLPVDTLQYSLRYECSLTYGLYCPCHCDWRVLAPVAVNFFPQSCLICLCLTVTLYSDMCYVILIPDIVQNSNS